MSMVEEAYRVNCKTLLAGGGVECRDRRTRSVSRGCLRTVADKCFPVSHDTRTQPPARSFGTSHPARNRTRPAAAPVVIG
jgi:hypothetical protein